MHSYNGCSAAFKLDSYYWCFTVRVTVPQSRTKPWPKTVGSKEPSMTCCRTSTLKWTQPRLILFCRFFSVDDKKKRKSTWTLNFLLVCLFDPTVPCYVVAFSCKANSLSSIPIIFHHHRWIILSVCCSAAADCSVSLPPSSLERPVSPALPHGCQAFFWGQHIWMCTRTVYICVHNRAHPPPPTRLFPHYLCNSSPL